MYNKKLKVTLENWLISDDEWLFQKFRDEIIVSLAPEEAFENIGLTVEYLLKNDEANSIELIETLISLAKISKTTEIPNAIFDNKESLEIHVLNFCDYAKSKLKELFSHYRI